MNNKLIAMFLTPDAIAGILCFAFAAISGAVKNRNQQVETVETGVSVNEDIPDISDPDMIVMVQPAGSEIPRTIAFPVLVYEQPAVKVPAVEPRIKIIRPEPRVIVKTMVVEVPEHKAEAGRPGPVYGRNGVKVRRIRSIFSGDRSGN